MSIGLRSLALAAALGATVAVLAMRASSDSARTASPPPLRAPQRAASPLTAAPSPVPVAAAPPRADAAPDDDALARHARDEYGFDCPSIVERGEQHDGYRDVTCGNGMQLRMYEVAGARPRFGAVH